MSEEQNKPAPSTEPATPAPSTESATPAPAVGVYGKFLKEKGIESTPLPLCVDKETIELKGSDLPAAIKLLRESPEAKLDFLVAVSGVDSPDTFDSVYHLFSYSKKDELVLKVRVPKTSVPADMLPEVPSISPYWPTADWHERETYDLVGIRYLGHRYLRRILNPWDWEGHPLRRDYKQPVDALNDKHPDSMR
jgi:NADH-quinone oxidoreductase subunit C